MVVQSERLPMTTPTSGIDFDGLDRIVTKLLPNIL